MMGQSMAYNPPDDPRISGNLDISPYSMRASVWLKAIRDWPWSLITGRVGGGASEILPLRKGGRGVLAMLKGGTKCFSVVFMW